MRTVVALVAAGALMLVVGCTSTFTPINGSLFVSGLKSPVMMGDNTAGHSKVGEASANGILGIVLNGDCSIKAAMDSQGITRVHHVDSEVTNILGIYAVYKTVVYGD